MNIGTKFKIKPEQNTGELPSEIRITGVNGQSVFVSSDIGTFESSESIISTFYDKVEDLTLDTMPKLVVQELDEMITIFETYAQTQHAATGIMLKTKILSLKNEIEKILGVSSVVFKLGKKVD